MSKMGELSLAIEQEREDESMEEQYYYDVLGSALIIISENPSMRKYFLNELARGEKK